MMPDYRLPPRKPQSRPRAPTVRVRPGPGPARPMRGTTKLPGPVTRTVPVSLSALAASHLGPHSPIVPEVTCASGPPADHGNLPLTESVAAGQAGSLAVRRNSLGALKLCRFDNGLHNG
eukprot:762812-Hanusia_phi.AAC.1